MTRAILAWLPAALWAALLFAVSSRPTLPVDLHSGIDKGVHFLAYLVLGVLLARGRRRTGGAAFWPPALGLLYALSDEVHQGFVPGRSPELGDWIADALGVLAGGALYHRTRAARRPSLPGAVPDSLPR